MASIKFIEECKEDANCNRLGTITVDGLEEPITNDDNLQSFSIDESCYVNGDIIGTVYIKKLDGQLLALPNDINLAGKVIHAKIGVKYADESAEYVEMGKYTVEHPKDEETADKCQITAYDDLTFKLDDEYVCGIDYSSGDKTLTDLYIDVCSQLGLTPKTTNILNGDIPISANPFTNKEKNRLVLQTIGKVSCSYAIIDKETNEIDLCWLSEDEEPSYTFERGDYTTLEGGKIQYGPINTVIIKNSQIDSENVTKSDEESVQKEGEHSIAISEDYILYNQDLRNLAMPAIYDRLLGLKYIEAKITTLYGKPFLKLGDKIRIMTENGYIDTYVLKHTFTYDGAFTSVIESPVLTEQEIKIKQNGSLSERLRRTEVEVNKQKGTIEAVVESVNTTTKSVNELEKSVNLFNAYLSRENLIISTDSSKKPLETKTYEIAVESYFKGELVSPSVSISGNNEGITAKVETGKIVIGVDSSTVITNTNNDYSVEISFMDGNTKYTSNKKLTVSLALSGAPGKDGAKGDKGDDGTPGKDGENGRDGVSNYTHIRYSQNANGDGMTTEATDAIYIGIAITTSATAPTSPSSYSWSKIKGDDGERGIDGAPGKDGIDGKDGTSSYLHIRWSEDGKTFSKPNLNNKKLASGFITTEGAFEEKNSTYPNSKYFEPFILKNGDTINIELPSSKDFRLRLFETDDRWITTVSLNGKEVSYKNSRGRDVKVYILFYSGISQEEANQVIFYKQSEIGKQPARYQGTYVDTNPTDSENFDDYNWVDTAIVVNEVIEEVKTNVADLEIGLDHVTTTVSESIETTNDIENRLTAVEQTASGLDIKVSDNQQKLDNLSGTSDRLKNLEDSNSKLKTNLETMQGTIEMMNFNFRTDGLHIGSDGVDVNSKLDNQGLRIYNVSTLISIFNKNGSGFEKLIVTESIQFQNLKFLARTIDTPTKSGRKVISCFWVEELIETLEDLED